MKKVLTLAAALLVFGASTSMAQGLNLHWNDCGVGGGATTMAFNCASNAGAPYTLIASVFPQAPMTQFAAATAVIDIGVQGGTLPQWWQTNSGQCRANAIAMSFDPSNNLSSCLDIWGGNPNLQVTAVQQGVNGPDRVRLNGVAAIPAGSEIPLAAGDELWLCRVTIGRAATLTCAGCALGASIVLNEVSIQSPSEPKQVITNQAGNYCVGNTAGIAFCPGATPTLNKTWGALKGLYN